MDEASSRVAEIRALVRAAATSDAAAFRRLVELHMRALYAHSYRLLGDRDEADDVTQETFVRAWSALDRYDERYTFYTWLRTIATRLALNVLAKRRRRRTEGGEVFESVAESAADPRPGPEAKAEASELGTRLSAALGELPDEQRTVLVLRAQEGMSYAEIASALAIPVGTVMSRLARARERLRAILTATERAAPMPGEGEEGK